MDEARELEDLIADAPDIAWRYDCGNWPGTEMPVMPEADRTKANEWLHRVYTQREAILKKRAG